MTHAALLLPLMLLAAPAAPPDERAPRGGRLSPFSVHQRIIVRIPRMPVGRTPWRAAAPPVRWDERKAPKCVPVAELSGATILERASVDLMMTSGQRIRAKLGDDCPTLDFYSGFYVKPSSDGMICADRDSIRSRSGGTCPIRRFRLLVPQR